MAEMNTQTIWTVTELNTFLKAMMDQKPELQQVHIKGEISNFVHHKSGHLYFSLKDEGGLLRAVMFRGTAGKLAFKPENGMKVVARGSISLYVKDGSYQLYVTEMEPDGIGAL